MQFENQEQMEEFGTCLFPSLTDGIQEEAAMQKRAVQQSTALDLGSLCDAQVLSSTCAQQGVAAPALFNTVWALVLARYLGTDKAGFLVVANTAGKQEEGVCRLQLDYTQCAQDIVRGTENTTRQSFALYAEQQLSAFDQYHKSFNSAVLFQGCDGKTPTSFLKKIREQSHFITLRITENDEDVEAILSYRPNFISTEQALNLATSFEHILRRIVAAPEEPLDVADMISPEHLAQMSKWNAEYPKTVYSCAHDLIDVHTKAQPKASAVVAWDGTLSYTGLDNLTNALAHRLVSLGIGPDVIVPLCFERSVWAIVAMIAVVKAGGAIVVVDPKQPKTRTAEIVSRVDAKLVLTSHKHQALWQDSHEVFVVDEESIKSLPSHSTAPATGVKPDNILYLIFTSGSTGKPKGCVIEHKQFLTAAEQHVIAFRLGRTTRTLQMTSYTFDASMLEVFSTLTSGGCICLPSEEDVQDGIASVIKKYKISFTFMTPSVVRHVDPTSVPNLKSLCLAGEALSKTEVITWADRLCLTNGYGPSECSVSSNLNSGISKDTDPNNIGSGKGALSWVVDANNHDILVPIGAIGELVVQGPIVGRGYFQDPDKTKEAFIQDPAFLRQRADLRGKQLYKTGDLVRFNSDSTVSYIGRKDTQVKLRGQRLELGEIEHHLKFDDHVRQATVLLAKSGLCKEQLTAVLSLRDFEVPAGQGQVALVDPKQKGEIQTILGHVRERLSGLVPVYMVPQYWAVLESVPRTVSGKTDRVLLRKWLETIDDQEFEIVAGLEVQSKQSQPTSEMEAYLQKVWSEVLNIPLHQIGMNRAFITLGGDSITSMQVVTRCRSQFVKITVQDILQSNSLAECALLARSFERGPTSAAAMGTDLNTAHLGSSRKAVALANYKLSKLGLISIEEVEDVYSCSPMQEGILLGQAKTSDAYEVRQIFKASSRKGQDLDSDRIKQAWQQVVNRHSTLRTVFADDISDESPFHQIVLRLVVAHIQQVEYKGPKSESDIVSFLKARPARINKDGPPYQLTQCNISSDVSYFMLSINHALIDGASAQVLLQEFSLAYDGTMSTERVPSYGDFISYLHRNQENGAIGYWKKYLHGVQSSIVPTYGGISSGVRESLVTDIEISDVSQLFTFCREHRVTPANVLKTAWGLVLRNLSDSDDVCFGYVASGRDTAVSGIENIIGPCINMLVCRQVFDSTSTITDLTKKMQSDYFAGLQYQHCSLAKIQNAMNMVGMPLFNSIMSVQRTPSRSAYSSSSVSFELSGDVDPTDFDIAIGIEMDDNNLHAAMGYWSSTMSPGEATNVASMFATAVSTIVASGDAIACKLDLFSKRDEALIAGWNAVAPTPTEACAHDYFVKQAKSRPEAPAICSWDGEFTFRQVDDFSSRLAHHLVDIGVKPESMVPFCFDKSAWATITVLSILKAGAAFVGMSPEHPRSRLQTIIEDCQALVVVVPPHHAQLFDGLVEKIVVADQDFFEGLSSDSNGKALPVVHANSPAYVSFTSGSTGKPKGILVEHRSLITAIMAHSTRFNCSTEMRSLQFAAYAFDASISDTIFVLIYGGCICVPSEQARIKDLAGAMNSMSVNWSFLTPKVASTLSPAAVPTLKTIILGGEAVSIEDVKPWIKAADVFIAYGPTETTICATAAGPINNKSDPLNLGNGVGNRLWVIDPSDSDRLNPVGTIGELLIEGPLVARGYVREPEKTKAVFIEQPAWFSKFTDSTQVQRFYKTGDLVRYNLDGTINFIGRKDNQVKIRGLRIELGEIEHAVMNILPALAQVTVDAVTVENVQTLVAFVLHEKISMENMLKSLIYPLNSDMKIQFETLEKELARILPVYMIPSIFVPINRVPINLNGKVDRKAYRQALQALSNNELAAYRLMDTNKRAPSTVTEEKLQAIWADVLPNKALTIGADDSFFRLGGDSVTVMKLSSAARNAGMSISVADIFRFPQLCKMANVIDTAGEVKIDDALAPIEAYSLLGQETDALELIEDIASHYSITNKQVADIYPCAPLQEGLATLSIRTQGASMLRSVHQIPESFDIERFKGAWQVVVNNYSLLRTRIVQAKTSKHFQVVLRPEPISWQYSDSLQEYLDADEQIPVRLGDAFFRYAIIEEGNGNSYFVWTAHHACYDGWMIRLLFDQLSRIYNDQDELSPEVPYTRFIKFLSNVSSKDCQAYWEKQTAGEPPASFPRMSSATYQPRTNKTLAYSMDMARHSGSEITTSTLIRASWSLVLARYLDNADDVLFGQTLSGRNAPVSDIDTMLGPTVCVVPVKIHLDRQKSVSEFLTDVQIQASEMIPYEHYGVQNIRSINAAARAATDYKNVLITQAGDNTVDRSDLLGMKSVDSGKPSVETYALVVECTVTTDSLQFLVFYDETILSTQKVERMMHHLEHVLSQMNDESSMPLAQVSLFSKQDQAQVTKWNNDLPPISSHTMHEVISQQAFSNPSAQAVDSWDGQLTYRELETASSNLACHLTNILGIKAETLVPLCFEKSMWTIVIEMAVLKAGGACVMLNPEHPIARLRGILRDTHSSIVLVAPKYQQIFEGGNEKAVPISSEFIKSLPMMARGGLASVKVAPHNTAIVVFTSGSTGEPKGIVLEHQQMCSAAKYQGPVFGYKPGMRMLQFAHYTFDLSNAEIFYTLMHGGTVCVPSEHDRLNNLVGSIRAMNIDTLILTPTVATLIDPKDVPCVKTLTTAGEPADRALQLKWSQAVQYNNGYGPAETTSWSSRSISSESLPPNNVGHAVGCRYWIAEISDHDQLTPVGCVGEVLLDGPIVSRGYLNRPEKTSAAFITNPSWLGESGGEVRRVYKSGDLARYAEDGSLLIAGRKDAQVKLHGQRIELGEIEHHLRVHPEIEAATVMLPKSGLCQGRLVAAVALKRFQPQMREGTEITLLNAENKARSPEILTKIRQYLEDLLPPYMVPATWMVMDNVPLTPSRKINRNPISIYVQKMSPEIYSEIMNATSDATDIPTTEVEGVLQTVWSDILGLPKDKIGVSRSFLGLGGDSIAAMQVVSRCRIQYNLSVTVKEILQSKSLTELSLQATPFNDPTFENEEVFDIPLALSSTQQMYFDRILPSDSVEHRFNESLLLSFTRSVAIADVAAAIHKVVSLHSVLRTSFPRVESGRVMQIMKREAADSYEFAAHDKVSTTKMMQIIASRQYTMYVERGQLFKVDLFKLVDGRQMISLVAHQLIADAESLKLIVRNFEDAMTGKSLDKPSSFQTWTILETANQSSKSIQTVTPSGVYWGLSETANVYGNVSSTSFIVDEKATFLILGNANNALRTEPTDIILSVLLHSFAKVFDKNASLATFREARGLESSINTTSTIGPLTKFCYTDVAVDGKEAITDVIRHVKDSVRQQSVQLNNSQQRMEMLFKYIDHDKQAEDADGLLQVSSTSMDCELESTGMNMRRQSIFEVCAVLENRKLQITFKFNRTMNHQDKIRNWMKGCMDSFMSTVKTLSSMKQEYTLSDFPLLPIGYGGLASLSNTISKDIGITNSNVEDIYPCSPMQEGILLSQARELGSYDIRAISEARSTTGMVDVYRLQSAWQQVVDRHPMLRTVFIQNATGDGHFGQLVMKQYTVGVKLLQYDGEDVITFLKNQPSMQSGLSRPPHQVTFCLSKKRVVWQLDISHALVDGSALEILAHELIRAYENNLGKEPAPLYSDYIAYLQAQPEAAAAVYWTDHLNGIVPCNFPALLEQPEVPVPKQSKSITANLATDLNFQGFCEKFEVSLANIFQAAWGLVLRAYLRSDSVNFGYLTSGRDVGLSGAEATLGPLINLLVCRLDMADKTPAGIVKQMQHDYLTQLPHQHTSLAKIRQNLGSTGSVQFNTAMSFQRIFDEETKRQVSLEAMAIVHPTEWDIAVQVLAGTNKVDLTLLYWDTKMSEEQAAGVIETYRLALKAISESPETLIPELKYLIKPAQASKELDALGSGPIPVLENEAHSFWTAQIAGISPVSFPKTSADKTNATTIQRKTIKISRNGVSDIAITTILRSAWASVLGRWSDANDIVYGIKVGENEALPFPVRLERAQNESIASFLAEIQDQSASMRPFEQVKLESIRALGGTAVAVCDIKNLMIVLPPSGSYIDQLRINENDINKYALIVQCKLGRRGIVIEIHADSTIVLDDQAAWMLSHFENAIDSLCDESEEIKLKNLEIFGEKDSEQLQKWNATYPNTLETTLHAMIKEQTLKTPNAEAVVSWDGQFTYEQLDAFSDSLGAHLRDLGVGPNVIVALCFDKCVWVPAVQIAVLKAGGAFLSLNPTHSITRLADQVSNASASLIISATKHARVFAEFTQAVVEIGPGHTFTHSTKPFTPLAVDPSCPAYLISTSGSTGKPKFPLLEHRAICTSIRAQCEAFGIGQGLRVLQFAAFTFDVSIIEIFGTLAHGGTVCIPSDEERMNDLGHAMDTMKVEFAHFTPTVLGLLRPEDVPTLKAVGCGGEKMTEVVVATWAEKINLINVYGPTEAAVNCACNPHFTLDTNIATIGRSVGSRLWISDSEDPTQLAPVGCVGELLIEGPILSRGYLNEPEKTAAAFIDSPAWLEAVGGLKRGSKIYRTGDLAKYNMAGEICILGRRDAQMKINGLRIEAGEVEFQIKNRRPEWQDVAVEVIQQSARGGKKALAAFFQYNGNKGEPISDDSIQLRLSETLQSELIELQSDLPTSLPPYMVPSMYISVESMPYTVSGKLDRKALRSLLDTATREQLEHYSLAKGVRRAPVTAMETVLAGLWAQVLRISVDTIGLDDNFFQLGGDSIIAMKLVSTARTEGYFLNVADVFRCPRLVDAAVLVTSESQQANKGYDDKPKPFSQLDVPDIETFLEDVVSVKTKVQREEIVDVLEANDIQTIALAASMTESRWMLNYFYFEGTGKVDFPRLQKALCEWVNRIEILRTVYMVHKDKFWQVVLKHVVPKVTYLETDEELAAVNDSIFHAGRRQAIHLEEPLMQFYVVQKKDDSKHRIILRISHAQYDGLSWPQLINTLIDAYEGRPTVEEHPFSEFATQTKALHNEECYDYWRNLLDGSQMLDIIERQASFSGGSRSPIQRTAKEISYNSLQSEGITFATVIKAAWSYVLTQIHGSSDVTFGHTIGGRNSGGADVVGPCINVIPVRVKLDSVKKVMDLLKLIQQQQVSNIPYETLGSREIIRQCTGWAPSTFFSTIVQHQNIDEYEPFQLGGVNYEQGSVSPELELLDILGVHSKPKGDKMEITLIWSPKVVPPPLAAELLDLLCSVVVDFSAAPYGALPKPYFERGILPLPATTPTLSSNASTTVGFDFNSEKQPRAGLKELLEQIWREVLFTDSRNTRKQTLKNDSSFFDLGGDMVQVVQTVLQLAEHGISVKVEDLLHNPTLESQVQLLSSVEV